jgi:peptide/nickel transport system ATP-binding protein
MSTTDNTDLPLLEVDGLTTHFFTPDGVVHAVDGVSFTVEAGQTLGVVGESGCGKSVMARSIMNMVRKPGRIVDGAVRFRRPGTDRSEAAPIDIAKLAPNAKELRRIRWKEISMIFQEPMTSLSPVHTVGNQMDEAVMTHLGLNRSDASKRSIELLGRVGLPAPEQIMKRYRHQLSGGMRQRVMIAMALSCDPALLIADEPTTALDVTTQAQILELLNDLQDEFGMAILFITHDLGVVAEMADHVMVMYLGREVESSAVDQLYHQPSHPYTRSLLRSVPRPGHGAKRLATIEGSVPDPLNLPDGCTFHPRCPHYRDAESCRQSDLIQVGDQQWTRCTRSAELPPFDLGRPAAAARSEVVGG